MLLYTIHSVCDSLSRTDFLIKCFRLLLFVETYLIQLRRPHIHASKDVRISNPPSNHYWGFLLHVSWTLTLASSFPQQSRKNSWFWPCYVLDSLNKPNRLWYSAMREWRSKKARAQSLRMKESFENSLGLARGRSFSVPPAAAQLSTQNSKLCNFSSDDFHGHLTENISIDDIFMN